MLTTLLSGAPSAGCGPGAPTFWMSGTSILVNATNNPIDCACCPCTPTTTGCGNCDTATAKYQYTVTFGGSTSAGSCAAGDCDDFAGAFVLTSDGDATCTWTYTGSNPCGTYQIQLDFLDFIPASGYTYITLTIGAVLVARWEKAWAASAPPADCATEVLGSYTLESFDGSKCDLSLTTATLA